MSKKLNLEPKVVFDFFETIASIPHGSYNTKRISDYLVSFAKDRDLDYYQDECNNVIIRKPASPVGATTGTPAVRPFRSSRTRNAVDRRASCRERV